MNTVIDSTDLANLSVFSFRDVLSKPDSELYEKILHAWEARRRGTRNHAKTSFKRDVGIVNNFIAFSGTPPWNWTEEDFDEWCMHLGLERHLSSNSQRSYQTAIRMFLKYVTESHKFSYDIKKLCGHSPKQICNQDNCIPHLVEREVNKIKPSFSLQEINTFFDTIDEKINECKRYEHLSNQSLKSKHSYQRDKAMFATLYTGALRASEGSLMEEFSFDEEPELPELGDYGYMQVMGKGANGSGKRHGEVAITSVEYVEVMEWYMRTVRPWFLERAVDPNETALFLSERGKRVTYGNLRKRFNEILEMAGLDKKKFTLHSFRRAGLFHDSCNMTIQAVKAMARHADIRTTFGYFPEKDPYNRDEFISVIRRQLKIIEGKAKAAKSLKSIAG